jgi:hypothetical protein
MTGEQLEVFGAFMREIDEKDTVLGNAGLRTASMGTVCSPLDLFYFISAIQLTLRHPTLAPPQRTILSAMLVKAMAYFADCPTVLEVIRFGEDGLPFQWWT